MAQGLYYCCNTDSKEGKNFTEQMWMVKTIGSLLDFVLGLWKNRCGTIHE